MPRSQKSNRRRSTITKVKRKQSGMGRALGKQVDPSQRFQASSLEYDEKSTQFSNYARLGLMADANQLGAARETITGFNPRVKLPRAMVAAAAEASAAAAAAHPAGVHPLEAEVPEGLKVIRQVPEGEAKVLLKLEAVHGTDYAAMARDLRLNAMQHTAAWLKKRLAKFHEEEEEEQKVLAAAAEAGKAAPVKRHSHKATKHPNQAFAKRSKHFL